MGCIFSQRNTVEPLDQDCQSEDAQDIDSPKEEDKIIQMFSVDRPTQTSQEFDSELDETFITEFSDKALVDQVEKKFKEKECLSLTIIGTSCQSRLRMTQKQTAEYEEAKIIAMLKEEGLISRPEIRTTGGLKFEIVEAHTSRERPPHYLEKLETRKYERNCTIDEQLERIRKAEQRRKDREDDIVKRNQMESQKRRAALERVNERKRENEDILEEKMENVEQKRERRLEEIRERMKKRERRAERVRLRKGLNLDDVGGVDGEQDN